MEHSSGFWHSVVHMATSILCLPKPRSCWRLWRWMTSVRTSSSRAQSCGPQELEARLGNNYFWTFWLNWLNLTESTQVYMWDLRTFTALNKFTDDGSLSTTGLALSSHYLATGSSSGVVNIYSLPSLRWLVKWNCCKFCNFCCKGLLQNLNQRKSCSTLQLWWRWWSLTPLERRWSWRAQQKRALPRSSTSPPWLYLKTSLPLTIWRGSTVLDSGAQYSIPFSIRIWLVSCSPGGGYLSFGNNRGSASLFRLGHYLSYWMCSALWQFPDVKNIFFVLLPIFRIENVAVSAGGQVCQTNMPQSYLQLKIFASGQTFHSDRLQRQQRNCTFRKSDETNIRNTEKRTNLVGEH